MTGLAPLEYIYLVTATAIGAGIGLAKAAGLRLGAFIGAGCVAFYGAIGAALIATGPYSSQAAWAVASALGLVGGLVVARLLIARIR